MQFMQTHRLILNKSKQRNKIKQLLTNNGIYFHHLPISGTFVRIWLQMVHQVLNATQNQPEWVLHGKLATF